MRCRGSWWSGPVEIYWKVSPGEGFTSLICLDNKVPRAI